jgi:5-formyltetrahydrofolate cyclo-ligase
MPVSTQTPTTQTRAGLRRRYREARRALSDSEQTAHAHLIARHFLRSPVIHRTRRIALYTANDGEPDLQPLARRLAGFNKTLALPVVRTHSRMDFYRYEPSRSLVPNRYGIGEPAPGAHYLDTRSVDVMLMPLVAFDDGGNRLGMGAGFYDRHLQPLPTTLRPKLIGVAHEVQRSREPLPAARWDVPLDAVLTEAGWQVWNLGLGF